MQTKEQKDQIQQAKTERKIAKWSKDHDASRIINWIFGIFGGLLIFVFLLEGYSIGFLKKEPGTYVTQAFLLAIVAYFAGYASSVVQSHFLKKAQEEASEIGGKR